MGRPFYHRRSIRLPGYRYTAPAAYFVTVLTHLRWRGLARVTADRIVSTHVGEIVAEIWRAIPQHHYGVDIDAFVVMPDHVHGILVLPDGARRFENTVTRPHVIPGSLGAIVRSFKAASARKVRLRLPESPRLWHRNYYEQVIRGERSLDAVRRYVEGNPAAWIRRRQAEVVVPVVRAQHAAPLHDLDRRS